MGFGVLGLCGVARAGRVEFGLDMAFTYVCLGVGCPTLRSRMGPVLVVL